MKVTFLIALPRCGSLALSVMHNTDHCLAHHEGLDYKYTAALSPDSFKFEDTYAYQAMMQAKKQGKNYFCCDQSTGIKLYASFLTWKEKSKMEGIEDQVLYIPMNPAFVCKSFLDKGVGDPKNAKIITEALRSKADQYEGLARMMEAFDLVSDAKRLLVIAKVSKEDSLTFKWADLIRISQFVGSVDVHNTHEVTRLNHLSMCRMSMSDYYLKKSIAIVFDKMMINIDKSKEVPISNN